MAVNKKRKKVKKQKKVIFKCKFCGSPYNLNKKGLCGSCAETNELINQYVNELKE